MIPVSWWSTTTLPKAPPASSLLSTARSTSSSPTTSMHIFPRGALNVGNMCIDVVGEDEVDLAVLSNELAGGAFGKVVVDHHDTGIIDGGDDVRCRIDADQGADSRIRQRPQQHAVIAAELQHRGIGRIEKPLGHLGGIFLKMVAQGADRGGEIEIVLE